ncbi:hypothetical protein L3Q65_14930 [Amycolatopsis sp. FU40]|uniref:hypothetical protein n=1 Tax=Amycolatopsis sp. FU40 TaxID=2914159 RepID=UPI001F48EDA2|nr:hypothetical protein [Amycolatopsis sp. FU40]UKD57964.1 hypothetical protein L3Q65_14930 [Amycolatopsis sp. FU40]
MTVPHVPGADGGACFDGFGAAALLLGAEGVLLAPAVCGSGGGACVLGAAEAIAEGADEAAAGVA